MAGSQAEKTGDACLRVLVNIDITGSMGNELEGVKSAVSEFAALCADLDAPVNFAIATFTESDKRGCFVSLKEMPASEEAVEYVRNIMLAKPPDARHVTANGDDGPENQKAALFKMCELDPSIPTIAFLITDAEPHMRCMGTSPTSEHELVWLQTKGLEPEVAKDLFRVFEKVLNHFGDNLVLNCVLYNGGASNQSIYGSLAQRTGGMLMQPRSRSASVLADGLMAVVKTLISRMQQPADGADIANSSSLDGFTLMDISSLPGRNTEEEPGGHVRAGDTNALFQIAMERMVAVCGTKWGKRAMGITAPAQQLEFVWRTARYIAQHPSTGTSSNTKADAELAAVLRLRDSILKQLPPTAAQHFTVTEQDIKKLAEQWAADHASNGGASSTSVSAISLESVGDVLEDGSEDWDDLLHAVMKLLHGYPIRLQLPKDKFGNPDFMDAWSAVMEELGCDRLASSEFLQLLGPNPSAKGITDRGTHNAFLILADPSDKLASLVLTIASGTQVLNYATGVLMGAPGFLPNLYPGTVAACLMRLLCQKDQLSEFQLQQAEQMVHALRCLHRNPAPSVTRQLQGGVAANPADNISKLLAALIQLQKREGQKHSLPHMHEAAAVEAAAGGLQAEKSTVDMEWDSADDGEQGAASALQLGIRLVFEEWLASLVQRHYGKRTPETDRAYLQSLLQYLPPELLLARPVQVDPLQELHPLEQPAAGDGDFKGQWEQQVVARLKGEVSGVAAHPAVLQFEQGAQRLLGLLHREGWAQLQAVGDVWPGWECQGLLPALLLRLRTARYSNSSAPAGAAGGGGDEDELVWERVEVGSCQELAWKRLREAIGEQLEGYRKVRAAAAEEKLLAAVAARLVSLATDEVGAVAALKDLFLDVKGVGDGTSGRPAQAPKGPLARLLNVDVSLGRSAVPAIIEKIGEPQLTPTLLKVLVIGEWTTTPAQALRRADRVRELCKGVPGGEELLRSITAVQMCARIAAAGANRHGHNVERQYPGPDGWTREYAAAREQAAAENIDRVQRKISSYLQQMQKFTWMAAEARRVAAGLDVSKQQGVERILAEYVDANMLAVAEKRLTGLLGQPV